MKKQRGFALIEVLVILAVIGLLSTLFVVAWDNASNRIACENGDMSACAEIEARPQTDSECQKKKSYCRYKCTLEDSVSDDCLTKCEIKEEYCNSK